MFLRINGYRVVDPEETLFDAIALAQHRMDRKGLAEVLRKLAREVGPDVSPE